MTVHMRDTIPWAEPTLWGREEEYAVDALRSTWISGGPYVERLEADFARYTDARHVLAVANGTAALHLAYLAAGIGVGDEIIVPGFAFMAAANMARMVGATLPTYVVHHGGNGRAAGHRTYEGDRPRPHVRQRVRARTAARARGRPWCPRDRGRRRVDRIEVPRSPVRHDRADGNVQLSCHQADHDR
jgi:hypothetical protein